MNLSKTLATGLLLSSIAVLSACVSEPQGQNQAANPVVNVATVINERLTEWDEFTGRLEAPENVTLRPRVSGYIEQVAFDEGALVNTGDVLLYIDDRPFQAEVKRLRAELATANSQLTLANSELARAEKLRSQNAIATEVVDNRRAQQQSAAAQVDAIAAALELAELNLSYTEVTAPVAGRVSRAASTKGNYVEAGRSLLTTIMSTDKVYAYFDADEQTYLEYVKLAKQGSRPSSRDTANPVFMSLANENGFEHQGYIDFVDNQVNPQTGTIRGRAVFDNSANAFIPGLFARIKLVGSATYDGILIDDKAIGTDLSNKFVLVLDDNNVVQYRAVELGEKLQGLRIVESGLEAGEQIVVNGLQRVRPGTQVSPKVVEMANLELLNNLHAAQQRVDNARQQAQVAFAAKPASNPAVGG